MEIFAEALKTLPGDDRRGVYVYWGFNGRAVSTYTARDMATWWSGREKSGAPATAAQRASPRTARPRTRCASTHPMAERPGCGCPAGPRASHRSSQPARPV